MKLTDTRAREAQLPAGKSDVILFDDGVPGFGLRIRKRENKAAVMRQWIFQGRRADGGQVRIQIGDAADIKCEAARETARIHRNQLRQGDDPRQIETTARDRAAETFATISARYLKFAEKQNRLRTMVEKERHLDVLWGPFARLSIHKITRAMVANRIGELIEKNGPIAANRARANLSAFFSWAMREGIAETNPVIATNKAPESVARERVLTDAELAAVWSACRVDDYGRIVRLLMLTGQRRDEVGGLDEAELDLEAERWLLPADRSKNGRAHLVPLTAPALDIVRDTPRRDGRSRLFGEGEGGFSGWSKAKLALDKRIADAGATVAPWTLHDLRRTCSTVMHDRLGVLPHIVEAVLNHRAHKQGVAGTYNVATYAAEKRTALVLWADHVMKVTVGAASNVVTLRAAG